MQVFSGVLIYLGLVVLANQIGPVGWIALAVGSWWWWRHS